MDYLARFALIVGAAALFAACGGSQSLIGATGAAAQTRVHRQSGSSGDLLYGVWGTGATNMIYVLTYPGGTVVSSKSLPNDPFGSCVDTSGNVFVASQGKSGNAIYEFSHGGVTPIETLNDSGRAGDCSVDTRTGNLAVANWYDTAAPGGPGPDIAVYAPGQQTPVLYSYSEFFEEMQSCAYDDEGNLFISGIRDRGGFVLAELAYGASSISLLSLDVTIGDEQTASLRWDGTHVALTTQGKKQPTTIYQLSISGSAAEVVGTTTLKSHSYGKIVKSAYGWILAGQVVEPTNNGIGLWRYPNGGKVKKFLKSAGGGFYSLTISVAPTR